MDDLRLKVVSSEAVGQAKDYGRALDDRDALKALKSISLSPEQTAEALVALVLQNSRILAEVSARRREAVGFNVVAVIDRALIYEREKERAVQVFF